MPPGQLPRLVSHDGPLGLRAHLERYGQLPASLAPGHPRPAGSRGGHDGAQQLIAGVERAGLTGRGGAGFPTARKMRAVAAAAGRVGAPGRGGQGRAGPGRGPGRGGRGPAVVVALIATGAWLMAGPLKPDWSRRAGMPGPAPTRVAQQRSLVISAGSAPGFRAGQ